MSPQQDSKEGEVDRKDRNDHKPPKRPSDNTGAGADVNPDGDPSGYTGSGKR